MSKKDYVFVLILDTSGKKHVFLFSDSFFSRVLKPERNPQSRAILSSVSKLFSVEGREGHSKLFMCCFSGYGCCCQVVPHVSMLPSLDAVVCLSGADSATKHPLLEAPITMPVTAKWKMWSGTYGAFAACLSSSSVYTGKRNAELRKWRERTWEKWEAECKGWKKPRVKATEVKLAG